MNIHLVAARLFLSNKKFEFQPSHIDCLYNVICLTFVLCVVVRVLFGAVLPTPFLSLFESGLALSLTLWPLPAPLLSHECCGPRESRLEHRVFIELISVMMRRSRSSI